MAENEKQPDTELEREQSEIRQRLIRRVLIAIGLVGAAAISLPLLDKFKSSPEVKLTPPPASDGQTTRIIPAPSKTEPSPPEPGKATEASAAKPETTPATTPAESVPTKPAAAPAVEPSKSAAAPAAEPKAATHPSTPAEEKQTPPPPVVAALPKSPPVTTLPAKPVEPASHKPTLVEPDKPETPLKPVAQAPKETAPPEKPASSEIPVVPRNKALQGQGYTVQLGVFANYANAQALQQRLAANGIKAHLETRVQLGPFQDRQEAEAAYKKIKQLGLPAVLVGQ